MLQKGMPLLGYCLLLCLSSNTSTPSINNLVFVAVKGFLTMHSSKAGGLSFTWRRSAHSSTPCLLLRYVRETVCDQLRNAYGVQHVQETGPKRVLFFLRPPANYVLTSRACSMRFFHASQFLQSLWSFNAYNHPAMVWENIYFDYEVWNDLWYVINLSGKQEV